MFKEEFVFVRILIPVLLGMGIFYFFPDGSVISLIGSVAIALFIFILSINLWYKELKTYKFKGISGALIYLLFFLVGSLLILHHNEKLKTDYFTNKKIDYLRIWVNDEPTLNNGILRFKARVVSGYVRGKQTKLSGQILIALKLDHFNPAQLMYGDELIIASKYLAVEPSYNPAEFDFKSWLAVQNIYEQTFVNQRQILKTGSNVGNPMICFALKLRAQQVAKYRAIIKNDEAFAVASTLILGYRADLTKETLSAYAKTGTIHALSVSGSHVAIIFFMLDFLLIFMDKNKWLRLIKVVLICSLIWIYALITGLSPSVVRSAIMITIFITAKTFAKNKNGYNTLAFAAFCQLCYNPFLIWDVGFQLSYLSVFGLIYLQPKIYSWIYIKNTGLNKVWELIALSIAAQIVTFPLSIYYFHQFPVYFLLGNLFISIPLIVIMVLGIAILVPFLDKLSPLLEYVIIFTNQILKGIAQLPYATFSSIWINLPELLLLSLGLGILVYALAQYNKKLLFTALGIFIIYQIMLAYDNLEGMQQKKIIFFSLRKNYAVAFIDGHRTILLTDLNARDKTFEYSIQPALDRFQVNKIKFIDSKTDTMMPNFIIKDSQIIFDQYKMLIIDERWNGKVVQVKGKFNAVWFTGNTRFKLEKLPKEIEYQHIIIDASNKDYKIELLKKSAENNHVHAHILKKNPAYLVQLTQ